MDTTSHPTYRRFGAAVAAISIVIAFVAAADAQIQPGSINISLQPVATGLNTPVNMAVPNDGSNRQFVVDQTGPIRIIQNGNLLPTPFVNLSGLIPTLNQNFDERGVLGMAFHPNYTQNGRFFVRYSAPRVGQPGEVCTPQPRGCHEEVLAEFTRSATDPNIANPNPTILFRVNKPQFNHDGGGVRFGPDGMLYFTLGDGGGANDGLADNPPSHGPIGNGQNLQTPLGKMLRVDVSTPGTYTIPNNNVFAPGGTRPGQGLGEIHSYGFRNPFSFSFDDRPGGTNELWVADVGQALFEEINVVQGGGNYGWVAREGAHWFNPLQNTVVPPTCVAHPTICSSGETFIDPVAEYMQPEGTAVIGGFVYRGSRFPQLYGKFIFGDFERRNVLPAGGRLFYLDADGNRSQIFEFNLGGPLGKFVRGIGQDENGEIYILTSTLRGPSGTTGEVLFLVPEPAGMALLLLGGAVMAFRRRRHKSPSSFQREARSEG